MRRSVLLLGSNGFIGKNLVNSLKDVYDLSFPNSKVLDLLDTDAVAQYIKSHKFDTIIHCATHNATITSKKDQHILQNNLLMFFNVARLEKYFKRMIYFGSGAEYSSNAYLPRMKESYFNSYVPTDEYGLSKYVMAIHAGKSRNIFDLRLFGVYGAFEDWRIRFISNAICRAQFHEPITIQKNVHFDYLYVKDLCVIVKKFIGAKTIPYHHFNICTGKSIDLNSIAKIVLSVSKSSVPIVIKKHGLKKEYSGDNRRLLNFIGKFPYTSMEQSINELYLWYKRNSSMINKNELIAYT